MTSPIAIGLFVSLALALAGIIGLELRPTRAKEDAMLAAPARSVPPSRSQAPSPAAGQREAWVSTILARPLFSPDRRPPPAAKAGPDAPAPGLPRVAGILLDGGRKSVIFAPHGNGRSLVVAEGAEFDGFRVQSIEAGQVTVIGPGGKQVLHPTFDPRPPAAAATPVVPNLQALTGIPGLSLPAPPSAR